MANRSPFVSLLFATGIGAAVYAAAKRSIVRHQAEDALLEGTAQSIVQSIASEMGCIAPRVRVTTKILTAAAIGNEIWVNPQFIENAISSVCPDPDCQYALVVGVLAHELAHIVYGHGLAHPSQKHEIELDADWFGGVACARLGISSEAFEEIIGRLSARHSQGPYGYPSAFERCTTIRNAFNAEWQRLTGYVIG